MKKKLFLCFIFIFMLVLGMKGVNAAVQIDTSDNQTTTTGAIAVIKLITSGTVEPFNQFEFDVAKTNVTYNNMTPSSGWSCTRTEGTNSDHYVCTYAATISTAGTYNVVTITYDKVDPAAVCGINVSGQADWFRVLDRKCSTDGTNFYDKNGNPTTEEDYKAQCEPKKTCVIENGKYYGKNGTEVTKDVYDNECGKKECHIDKDGKYYDKNGVEITEEEYNKICTVNPKTGPLGVLPFIIASIIAVTAFYFVKRYNKIY